ncbi:MAG: carboxyl transferase [Oscillospiraceae bacterium]|jgi:acetyl-CoA carboxylase carboxyltransferase component|nr:carboxyl transferase [Oscillospiraceae bacterium]
MDTESRINALSRNLKTLSSDSPARRRVTKLFDEGTFVELDAFARTSGEGAGVVTGYGLIDGAAAYIFSQDIEINSGAVDAIHAKKIKKVYELASMTGLPVIGIYDSNGALLDDMPGALAAYGEMILSANKISGVVPQISLILGTCAGSAAVAACGADLIVMSRDAEFFLNSPRIADNNGLGAPGAGTAENAAKSGVVHLVADGEDEAISKVRRLVACLPQNNLSAVSDVEYAEPAGAVKALRSACENIENVAFSNLIKYIADRHSFVGLSKDYGENAVVGFATILGVNALIVGADGSLGIDECNKIAYYVNLADSFSIPVITFVNTDGFSPSSEDELSGSLRHAAKLAHVYSHATTQKIAVITGKAYGSAYVALAGKSAGHDIVVAWPSAIISALQPSTAVAFIAGDRITSTKSREEVEAEYKITDASPFVYAAKAYIDRVIDPAETRQAVANALDMLTGKRVNLMSKKHSNIPL